jgi:hypothetical protein
LVKEREEKLRIEREEKESVEKKAAQQNDSH